MESSSVCDQTKSDDRVGESDLFNHEYNYRPNWTTRNSVTNYNFTLGAIHSTKISGNFGPKLNGSVRSNRKSFEKTGPPFEVVLFSRSDRSECWLNGSRPLGARGFSREFSVLAEGRSHERRSAGHYRELTETGNRSRKVSGTQGIITLIKFVIYKVLF